MNVARGNTLEPRVKNFSVNIHRSKILLTIKNSEKKKTHSSSTKNIYIIEKLVAFVYLMII